MAPRTLLRGAVDIAHSRFTTYPWGGDAWEKVGGFRLLPGERPPAFRLAELPAWFVLDDEAARRVQDAGLAGVRLVATEAFEIDWA